MKENIEKQQMEGATLRTEEKAKRFVVYGC